jgi:hypothetical protein
MPRKPPSDQLTLDDWADGLAASRDEPTAPDEPSRLDAPAARHPLATELLETPGALLTRSHLRELGLERRAVDAVFRRLPVVSLPGYSRPLIHAEEYLHLIDEHTYRGDRVRPLGLTAHG